LSLEEKCIKFDILDHIFLFIYQRHFKIINIAKSAFVTKRLYAIQHPAEQRYPRLSCFICRKASAATKPISLANSLAKFQSCSLSIASAPRISRERAVELSALKWLNFIKRYFSNYLRRGRREPPPCSCNHVYGVCWGRVSKL